MRVSNKKGEIIPSTLLQPERVVQRGKVDVTHRIDGGTGLGERRSCEQRAQRANQTDRDEDQQEDTIENQRDETPFFHNLEDRRASLLSVSSTHFFLLLAVLNLFSDVRDVFDTSSQEERGGLVVGQRGETTRREDTSQRNLRALHSQESRQMDQENVSQPRGQMESGLTTEMNVQRDDGDADGEIDQNQSEEKILAEQRNDQRGGRNQLDQEEIEDQQGDENGDGQSDLLPAVRGKEKDEHRENGDVHTRNDQIDDVEQRFALNGTGEGQVQIVFDTTGVDFAVSNGTKI